MIKHHEWLTRNSLRSFPVQEGARVIADSGWTLDPALIVDVSIMGDSAFSSICLQSVTITKSLCSVVFADPVSGTALASASVLIGTDLPMVQKPLLPLIDGIGGHISFGPAILAERYFGLPRGFHLFGQFAVLESRCFLMTGEFPVSGLDVRGLGIVHGDVNIESGDALAVAISEDSLDGDPLQVATLSLKNPSQFLSPCEEKTTPCDCLNTPVRMINNIPGDSNGIIFIEIEDVNGNIYALDASTLAFLISRTGSDLCRRPKMPDEYGRLPDSSGAYDKDALPATTYKNPLDTTFPEPPL